MQYQSILIQTKPAISSNIHWKDFVDENELLQILKEEQNVDKYILQPDDRKPYTVADIQNIIVWNSKKPIIGRYKACIIENAQLLSIEAQNKLLKTLEEPANNTIIVLVASNSGTFLDTILSRCKVFITQNIESIEEENQAVQDFISADSFNKRLKAIDELEKSDSEDFLYKIFHKLSEEYIRQRDYEKVNELLSYIELHRKNKYNIRLTLEALAIMLE